MLQKETVVREKQSVNTNITIPQLKGNLKTQKPLPSGILDLSRISNDIIFVGFSVLAIYAFYNVLISLFM